MDEYIHIIKMDYNEAMKKAGEIQESYQQYLALHPSLPEDVLKKLGPAIAFKLTQSGRENFQELAECTLLGYIERAKEADIPEVFKELEDEVQQPEESEDSIQEMQHSIIANVLEYVNITKNVNPAATIPDEAKDSLALIAAKYKSDESEDHLGYALLTAYIIGFVGGREWKV